MSNQHLVPLDTIVDMLAARAGDLARELLPAGIRDGQEWRVGSLAGERGRSLAVHLQGGRAGVWSDFASGEAGDALDLVAHCLFGGDKVDAIKWAKGWLGLDGTNPASLRKTRRAVETRKDAPPPDAEDAKKRAAACRIFLAAREDLRGTPADGYLTGRGLDISALPFGVGALRYHPDLWNSESGRKWPALVASIIGGAGETAGKQVAVHRTWLAVDTARRRVTKAPLIDAKRTLGRYRGGFISLWKGIQVDGETGEIRKAPPLSRVKAPVWVDLTEGIEDGLSVVLADPTLRVLVGVSVSNMAAIRLPEIVAGVVLWQQNDPPDSKAAKAFQMVIKNFQAQGKRVRLARPPQGFKDPNEMVQAALGEQQEGEAG